MPRLLLSTILLLSVASLAGGQDFSSLWNSITNGGSNVGNSAAGIASSAWNLIKNGGNTVGTGATNLTQSVGNFFRGNGFQSNPNYDQQRSSQSNEHSGQGYYGDSPYKYNGYDTQGPAFDQNQRPYGNQQRAWEQGNNGDSPYLYNGYQYATTFPNRGRR